MLIPIRLLIFIMKFEIYLRQTPYNEKHRRLEVAIF